jgi:uncharacterized protein YggU (UPF0235/DUF167 family)
VSTSLAIRVRPGQGRDALEWDAWRRTWTVTCRAPPHRGEANAAVRALVAAWLDVPVATVGWDVAGRAPEKRLRVEGLTPEEAERRLRARVRGARSGGTEGTQ